MFQQNIQVEEAESWISVSDLMAGLMVFFLFIAILYIQPLQRVLDAWQDGDERVYEALDEQFRNDLQGWEADLDQTSLSIIFSASTGRFEQGSSRVTAEFALILDDFFPRYLDVLKEFYDEGLIEEIRIEGHTSSEWRLGVSEEDAYFRNLELSQDRTRAVLKYALIETEAAAHGWWARDLITANGLSSSKVIRNENGLEQAGASRRVEFRVRTATQQRLQELQGEYSSNDD